MAERLGYVVAVINQASGIAEDVSSTCLHGDLADAAWEHDLRTDETRAAGRHDRYIICEVIPVGDDG